LQTAKPQSRSKLRLQLGIVYHIFKQYLYWHFYGTNFAQSFENYLPYEIFTYQTILRRKLRQVDMWMQENKINNLKIAIKQLDKLIIEPGQTFSYWRQIGMPTKNKGYLEGMILNNGQVISGVGGGLCQLSNLLYWLTLHTPLTVIERWRHDYDVFPDVNRSQPFGSGATCSYPNIDLQIKNNTEQKFQLQLELTDEYLKGKWLSDQPITFAYKIFEKHHEIRSEWWGGYSRNNHIFRQVIDKKSGQTVGEEFVAENKAIMMYEPLLANKFGNKKRTIM